MGSMPGFVYIRKTIEKDNCMFKGINVRACDIIDKDEMCVLHRKSVKDCVWG